MMCEKLFVSNLRKKTGRIYSNFKRILNYIFQMSDQKKIRQADHMYLVEHEKGMKERSAFGDYEHGIFIYNSIWIWQS